MNAVDITKENVFVNKRTHQIEPRKQYGLYGNVWLSDSEVKYLGNLDIAQFGLCLTDIIDEVDAYVEQNSDGENNRCQYLYRNSFFYIRSWINRKKEYKKRFGL